MSRIAELHPYTTNEVQPPAGSINGILNGVAPPFDSHSDLRPTDIPNHIKPTPRFTYGKLPAINGVGLALSDTPAPSAPSSPRM
jgi:hypothetical protein